MRALQIQKSPMPGFALGMGITLTMLSLIVLLPIGALLMQGAQYGAPGRGRFGQWHGYPLGGQALHALAVHIGHAAAK